MNEKLKCRPRFFLRFAPSELHSLAEAISRKMLSQNNFGGFGKPPYYNSSRARFHTRHLSENLISQNWWLCSFFSVRVESRLTDSNPRSPRFARDDNKIGKAALRHAIRDRHVTSFLAMTDKKTGRQCAGLLILLTFPCPRVRGFRGRGARRGSGRNCLPYPRPPI